MSFDVRAAFPQMPSGADALIAALVSAATPQQELTVSEWADRYRRVSAESGSPFPGQWRTDRAPYLREPMDCLHPDHPARRVTMKFSAQTGKSETAVNWFGYVVDRAPGPMLTVLPTGEEAQKYNRVKLQPTIDASPKIRHRVRPENSRDEGASTTSFKRFAGGFDQITSATSSKGLQMVSIRWLILDEVSGYPKDADGRGDPVDQARARTKAFGDRAKELIVSTPGMVGDCRVSQEFEAGDRRRYYLPCPECGAWSTLRYDAMQAACAATQWRAAFAQPCCGAVIDQSQMNDAAGPGMRIRGRWVPTRVEEGEAPVPEVIGADEIEAYAIAPCEGRVARWQPSYALWSAYSAMESWTDIWRRGEDAKGDPVKLKVFVQQDLGEPYEPRTDTPDWEKLLAVRVDWPRGVAPFPACVLTGFVDVQGNRFEWGVYAFGPGFRAWPVDRGVIAHDYTSDAAWAQLDQLVARRWPTASGAQVEVLQWGIDTGAFTQALYDRVAGRGLLLATKGDNRPAAAPLKKTRADLRDAQGRPIRGRRIDLALIGNFDLKSSVYEGLRSLVAGPDAAGRYANNTLHLPIWFGEDELKQLTAEVLIDPREDAPQGRGKGKLYVKPADQREWRKRPHQPNEGLDIAVGCRALAWGEGAGQLTAEGWARWVAVAHGAAAPAPDQPPDLFGKPPLTAANAVATTDQPDDADVFARLAQLNSEDGS